MPSRLAGLLTSLLLAAASPAAAAPGALLPTSPRALTEEVAAAWMARSPERWQGLWRFATAEDREEELQFARARMGGDEVRVSARLATMEGRPQVVLQVFAVTEPRARLEEWALDVAPDGAGVWAVTRRAALSQLDGLSHIALDPQGYRADGRRIVLEDFELVMKSGTIFMTPPSLGPTALTFVGDATVIFKPRPAAEQQQLRQFAGRTDLAETVHEVFVRLHPADFNRVFPGGAFVPDPQGAARLAQAQRFHVRQAAQLYVLDTTLPRSPWWLLPSLGDASVSFATARRGVLTFSVFGSEAESISLVDRVKKRQICMYPRAGSDPEYEEGAGRAYDVLHHELSVRIDPRADTLQAVDDVTFDLRGPVSTLQMSLAEGMQVESVTSDEAGELLFFRVRHQSSLMVPLGPLSGRSGRLRLRIRYAGAHDGDEVDREALQVGGDTGPATSAGFDPELPIEDVKVFTNRTAWYPQVGVDDYATANLTLEVPSDYVAVTGGALVAQDEKPDRRVFVYRQDRPVKYLSVVTSRLFPAGKAQAAGVELQAWSVGRLRGDAAGLTADAASILEFYTREFGPAPYSHLNLVFAESRTPGGHSPAGLVLLNQRPVFIRRGLVPDPAGFHDIPGFFLAHELAHQWWGQGVSGQNYRERWISEGMAQYAATLWTRSRYGDERFRDVLRRMSRWARQMNDAGPIHLGQRIGHLANDPQLYRAVVYDKGAHVLHMLRLLTGDDAFRSAMASLQSAHRYGKIGTRDVQAALEAASHRPLGPYFDAWIYGMDLPALRLAHHTTAGGAGVTTTVDITADGVPGPLPVTVTLDAVEHTVEVAPGPSRHTFVTAGAPRRVELNRDQGLLATIR